MIVKVMLFARASELAGMSQLDLTLDEGSTVADLKDALNEKHPELQAILPYCTVAVDQEYANDSRSLSDGCEVGCIPPVSGG